MVILNLIGLCRSNPKMCCKKGMASKRAGICADVLVARGRCSTIGARVCCTLAHTEAAFAYSALVSIALFEQLRQPASGTGVS